MKRRKFFAAASSLAVLAAALLTGCGDAPQAGSLPAGTLTLRVNPEIQIAYDEKGKVLSLTGENGDGKEIVAAYPDYIGKDCEVVVQELVEEIHEAGYFVEEVEGEGRRIVLELEPGSEEPRDDFLEDMGRSAEETVKELKLSSEVNLTGENDGDDVSKKDTASSLTKDKKAEATPKPERKAQNGNSASKATDYDDTDYGPNNDGVTDYDDTDYGPNNDGVTDYGDTDYGPNNDGVTDYGDTDYGPNNDGVTDYGDTDYGPGSDGVTDYGDTDYGSNGDGVTDYTPTPAPAPAATPAPAPVIVDTDYGPGSDGDTDYYVPPVEPVVPSGDSGYHGDSGYDGDSAYDGGDSGYGDSGYDD